MSLCHDQQCNFWTKDKRRLMEEEQMNGVVYDINLDEVTESTYRVLDGPDWDPRTHGTALQDNKPKLESRQLDKYDAAPYVLYYVNVIIVCLWSWPRPCC